MSQLRRQRLWQLGAATVFALIVAVVVIVISQSSSDSLQHLDADEAAVTKLFRDIPQQGQELGSAKAKATLVEYADLQCPFCRAFTLDDLPAIVDRYVRPGDLRIRFEPQTIIGPQSEDAARAALAAGLQNRLWQFADLFYRNQDDENSGYVTTDFMNALFDATSGLDTQQALADMDKAAVDDQLSHSQDQFERLGLGGTPSFILLRPGEQPEQLSATELSSRLAETIG